MSILITGGTGFLGSNLLRYLLAAGNRIILLKRHDSNTSRIVDVMGQIISYDIDHTSPETLFRKHTIDTILHCATNYGRGEVNPCTVLEANLFLPLTLLEQGCKHGIRCFINTDTILDKRINTYSLSKAQFKEWLKLYSQRVRCINVPLEHFYGSGDDRTKFVMFIIHSLLEKVERIALTAGEQKRDFIYIDDIVTAFSLIIQHNAGMDSGYATYEIGTGEITTIRDFVCCASQIVGENATLLDFGALPYRDNEVMESFVDTTAIKNLGWIPKYSIEQGLRRTIDREKGLA